MACVAGNPVKNTGLSANYSVRHLTTKHWCCILYQEGSSMLDCRDRVPGREYGGERRWKMRRVVVGLVALALCLGVSGAVLANTQGYTSLGYAIADQNTKIGTDWYRCVEFTLYNNSNNASPYLDKSYPKKGFVTLVDKLNINFDVSWSPRIIVESPNSEWDYSRGVDWDYGMGYFQWERYAVDSSQKYTAPPSVEPSGSLDGFKTYFKVSGQAAAFTMPEFSAAAEVLSVKPNVDQGHPPVPALTYTKIAVNPYQYAPLCDDGYYSWWDCCTEPGGGTPNEPAVPEASTLMLALLGMGAPMGYLRMRNRAK